MEPKKEESLGVTDDTKSLKTIAHIVYLCQSLFFLYGITAVVGMVMNYVKLKKTKGTWLESHFRWQLKTFWLALVIFIIGSLFLITGWASTVMISFIGILIIAANVVWIVYRVVRGWIALSRNQPVKKKKE